MNEIQKKFIESPGRYLMHYNHNHDKLGRFARSNGMSGSGSVDRINAKEVYKAFKNSDVTGRKKVSRKDLETRYDFIDDVMSDEKVVSAKKEVDKSLEPVKEYYDDGRLRDKYAAIAGTYISESFRKSNEEAHRKAGYDFDIHEDRDDSRHFFISEDGDQGMTSSINFFLVDRGKDPSVVRRNYEEANEVYELALKNAIDSRLGDYSNKIVSDGYSGKDTLTKSIMNYIDQYDGYAINSGKAPDRGRIGDVEGHPKTNASMKEFMDNKYQKILLEDYNKELADNNAKSDDEIAKLIKMKYEMYGMKPDKR